MISSSGSSSSVALVFGKAKASAASTLTVCRGERLTRVFDFSGILGECIMGESRVILLARFCC